MVRVVAHIVAFSMCTNSTCAGTQQGGTHSKGEEGMSRNPPHAPPSPGAWPHLVHHLLGLAVADAQASRLVVGAVGAGDELPEGAGAGEPGLQVQLLTGRVVEGAWERGGAALGGAPLPPKCTCTRGWQLGVKA